MIRQFQRMAKTIGIDLRAQPLGDDVDEGVLEVLRNPGDKCHSHGSQKQQTDPFEEACLSVLLEVQRVFIDNVPEDEGIKE